MYCDICKKELKSKSLTQHNKTKRHISKMRLSVECPEKTKLDAKAIEDIIQRLMNKVITCRELRKQFIPEWTESEPRSFESDSDNNSLDSLEKVD